MRELIIEWIYTRDMYNQYTFVQLESMSDEELMSAHNKVVYNLCQDS